MNSEKKELNILVVDDEVGYQTTLSIILKSKGYSVTTVSDGKEALKVIDKNEIGLVITDLKMPGMDGIELIKRIKKVHSDIQIIVITAHGTIESAVEAIKIGADSYFVKSEDPMSLIIDVNRIADIKRLTKENEMLKAKKEEAPNFFYSSKNAEFKRVLEVCHKAADSNISVLLLGESGVGKEVIANYIHRNSERKCKSFVPANCQVFSDGTLESELFGHEKGAFTGALSKRIGRFEEANGGTVFLDEIGDLPMSTQGKILRTLENRTIERVGSNRPIDLDIRLISATNKSLSDLIKKGAFREDLLYRINTLTISIPPLRQRREDIPAMVDFFIEKIQKEQKKQIHRITKDVMDWLINYDYPGNVRELKNILERQVVLSDNGVIDFSADRMPAGSGINQFSGMGLRTARALFEAEYISKVIESNGGNVNRAAQQLEITNRQLWNKIAEYKIKVNK